MDEQEKELASHFSAKMENRELKERLGKIEGFLSHLRDNPPLWRRNYRKKIEAFCQELDL